MKKVCYLRISTDMQSHDMQRGSLERYFKLHDVEVEFYEETGSGGSIKRRPVFSRLMREVARGEVSHIYVYKLDRWARNTKDFLNTHEVMERAGCKFISTQDSIDFSTPIGRMFAQMLAVFAEFERATISSRVSAGRQAAQAKGVKFGHPKKLVYDVAALRSARDAGMPVREICAKYGVGRTTYYEALRVASPIKQSALELKGVTNE